MAIAARLWQQNLPAKPENSAAFRESRASNNLFQFTYFETGSQADAQRQLKSFLARNELLDSAHFDRNKTDAISGTGH
jgi:hypothetical protein